MKNLLLISVFLLSTKGYVCASPHHTLDLSYTVDSLSYTLNVSYAHDVFMPTQLPSFAQEDRQLRGSTSASHFQDYHNSLAVGAAPPPDPYPNLRPLRRLIDDRPVIDGCTSRSFSSLSRDNIFHHANLFERTLFGSYWTLLNQNPIPAFDFNLTTLVSYTPITPNFSRFMPMNSDDLPSVDLENVETAERRSRTKASLTVLNALVHDASLSKNDLFNEVITYLESLKTDAKIDGITEDDIQKALRTLRAPKKTMSDFNSIDSDKIYVSLDNQDVVTAKDVLTWTWWIITQHFADKVQDNLKISLVKALSQCIEDDGHRVCDNGKIQRLVMVLQGYIDGVQIDEWKAVPSTEVFLKAFFNPINDELMAFCNNEGTDDENEEKRQDYARKIYNSAMESARETYHSEAQDYIKEIENHIIKFLDLTLSVTIEPKQQESAQPEQQLHRSYSEYLRNDLLSHGTDFLETFLSNNPDFFENFTINNPDLFIGANDDAH